MGAQHCRKESILVTLTHMTPDDRTLTSTLNNAQWVARTRDALNAAAADRPTGHAPSPRPVQRESDAEIQAFLTRYPHVVRLLERMRVTVSPYFPGATLHLSVNSVDLEDEGEDEYLVVRFIPRAGEELDGHASPEYFRRILTELEDETFWDDPHLVLFHSP